MSTNNPTPSDRRRGSRKSALKAAVKPKYKPTARAPPPPRNTKESQEILDLFHHAFSPLFTPQLPELLQKVKTHLFNRDFLAAFGAPENLEAYVVRWSPSRALCYREVFLELSPALRRVFELKGEGEEGERVEIVCIGGGAGAEVVAVAAAVKSLMKAEMAAAPVTATEIAEEESKAGENTAGDEEVSGEPEEAAEEGPDEAKALEKDLESLALTPASPPAAATTSTPSRSLHMTAIDIADWTRITTTLTTALTTVPTPPRAAYLPRGVYSVDFHHHDMLAPSATALIPPSARLITLLFTTNELYTQSRGATTAFLLALGERVRSGCLLLVLESAGSYSTVTVNGRVFPMGMLLDHTLLAGEAWEKVLGEEARWFRLPEGLRYPIELENMRYMVRVYRKT
ncbi:uncharacterized protein LAJ45_10023 [Morchella importuna]|uniref:uncharacterized protein n=1 Tax=Morchella importuna TaxID=1174673 RepID=UPI001E8ED914|nr:uncharacterized protein LAJ45_10023 [Morchella importuna]KAH8145881.1 hypothetical protein LAJ45_10023 [Morchella importuna]